MFPQKGGVFVQPGYNIDSARRFFMDNCTMRVLSYTSLGGVIFILVLNEGVKSPYAMARSNAPFVDVKTLVMKAVLIRNNKKTFNFSFKEYDPLNGVSVESGVRLQTSSVNDFIDEVDVQADIFKKSFDRYLEPICPSIVGIMVKGPDEFPDFYDQAIFDKMTENEQTARNLFNKLVSLVSVTKDMGLGFIFMECLEGFKPIGLYTYYGESDGYYADQAMSAGLYVVSDDAQNGGNTATSSAPPTASQIARENEKNKIQTMGLYELLRLYNVGYIHGDPHKSNILFNPDYKYIDEDEYKGRAIILDFGRTEPHDDTQLPTYDLGKVLYANLQNIDPKWWAYKWLVDIIDNHRDEYRDLFEIIDKRRKASRQKFQFHIDDGVGSVPVLVENPITETEPETETESLEPEASNDTPPGSSPENISQETLEYSPDEASQEPFTPSQSPPPSPDTIINKAGAVLGLQSAPQLNMSEPLLVKKAQTQAPFQPPTQVQAKTTIPSVNYDAIDPDQEFTTKSVADIIFQEKKYLDDLITAFKASVPKQLASTGGAGRIIKKRTRKYRNKKGNSTTKKTAKSRRRRSVRARK